MWRLMRHLGHVVGVSVGRRLGIKRHAALDSHSLILGDKQSVLALASGSAKPSDCPRRKALPTPA
jgi:hypothetical protein